MKRKEKVSLFIFIDAFGWEVLQRHPFFLEDIKTESRKLDTILGYSSACDPSIISGRLPAEHRLWSSFYYSSDTCPYAWLKHLRFLPDAIFRRGRVRHYMSKLIKKIHGFTGYFQIYAVPFDRLPFFDYAEKKRIWEKDGLLRGKTIFDRMIEQGIPYYVHDSDKPDEARLADLTARLNGAEIDFAYISLGKLDALMHAVGTQDPKVGDLVRWYDSEIRKLLSAAEANYEEVAWYVFTDHGMHDVKEGYDLIADIDALGLEYGVDYVAFYDSTMGRFWFLNDDARKRVTERLDDHPAGRILSDDELRGHGTLFDDHMYGELVFLMKSHVLMVPSYMGVKQIAGMHGFDPSDPDSAASITTNRPLPEDLRKIHQIYHLMVKELNLQETP